MTHRILSIIMMLSICIIGISGTAFAQLTVPNTISYQGVLTDQNGTVFFDGTYQITVRLYSDPNGNTVVWEDTYTAPVSGGIFNLYLGDGNAPLPGSETMNTRLWVGTSVNGDAEMRPLTPLSSSPYALNVPDAAITTAKLADNAITANKVDMDYVSEIRVNGEKVSGKGTTLNIESSDDFEVKYDQTSQSLKIISPQENHSGTHDDNKGPSILANPNTWGSGGDLITPGGAGPLAATNNDWIGTSTGVSGAINFEVRVNSQRTMLYQPNGINTPNIVGGHNTNAIPAGAIGSIIAGGGNAGIPNTMANVGNYNTISGGAANTVTNVPTFGNTDYATIGGGDNNEASADHATIGGGEDNVASGGLSFIGGGSDNLAHQGWSTVAGGEGNASRRNWSVVGGGQTNTTWGLHSGILGGQDNIVTGDHSVIGGGFDNEIHITMDFGTIGGGNANVIGPNENGGDFITIGGGNNNNAIAEGSTISGGQNHTVSAINATIGGGFDNDINVAGELSTIGGGFQNAITARLATIGGGNTNTISAEQSVIGGGATNDVESGFSGVFSGLDNDIRTGSGNSVIGGGSFNEIQFNNDNAVIVGGTANVIFPNGSRQFIGGGEENSAIANHNVVVGGLRNAVGSDFASVGGGEENSAVGMHSTIPGGDHNLTLYDAQTAVGFYNDPFPGAILPVQGTDAPLFTVGNGSAVTRANAFEVSYNGHSIVYDVNGSGVARPSMEGGTFVDNVILAWGEVTGATGAVVSDFGVLNVIRTGVGVYQVTINPADSRGMPITIRNAAIVVTPGFSVTHACTIANTTRIGTPGPNQFIIRTHNPSACIPVDVDFMFHVTGRQ